MIRCVSGCSENKIAPMGRPVHRGNETIGLPPIVCPYLITWQTSLTSFLKLTGVYVE